MSRGRSRWTEGCICHTIIGSTGTSKEDENTLKTAEALVLNKVLLKLSKEVTEQTQWKALFRIVCKSHGKCCKLIIDNGNTDNLVSTEMVEKLGLKWLKHPTPYKASWL